MIKGSHHTVKTKNRIAISRQKYIGNKHPNWKGGKIIIDGYVYIYSPNHPYKTKDKYVCEHRLIMEKYLKRLLSSYEVVHHINNIKTDNRLSNLVLCASTGKHYSKYHIKRSKLGRFICA